MKSTVLLASAILFTLSLVLCEAAVSQKKCTVEGKCGSCTVSGKKGTQCCEGGTMSACTPDADQEGALCGNECFTAGKVCQDQKCVSRCKPGFTDCGGICRNLSHDSGNCGACGNTCRSGTSCQPSAGSGACGCTPPSIGCGDVCRNPTNDPSNCGACGNVCTAPITSCRNSQCVPSEVPPATAGSTGDLPLDLFWSTTDPNGLPFNPDWRPRSDPELVTEFHVDPDKACPHLQACLSDFELCERKCKGDDCPNKCLLVPTCQPRCTTFPVSDDNGIFCGTHINWIPATYRGRLEFDFYTARGLFNTIFKDDDYNFRLSPTDEAGHENGAGLLGEDTLLSEMSFLETVNHFESRFWSNFRSLVDQGDDPPKALFDGRQAIVTGLVGIDTHHGVHVEVHPIYAMALRRTEDPIRQTVDPRLDCWAIFARNWGNEGGCSRRDHDQPDWNHITFHLPQPPGATAVTETFRDVRTNNTALTAVSEVGRVGDGAEITIFLGRPDDRTQVNGEVCLRWAVPPGVQLPQAVAPARHRARPKLDRDQEQYPGIELLTPAQLDELKRSLPVTPPRDKRLDMQVPRRVPFVRDLAKKKGPALVLADHPGPVDAQKQARDRQIQSLICHMLRSHPKRPKVCNQF